jgi:hypothetical protein
MEESMEWTGGHPILEIGYWVSQMMLAFIALAAAIFAYRQVTAYSMFELLKYTADEDARLARAKVIRELSKKSYEEWKEDGEAIKAAGRVCAYYNIMARVLQAGMVSDRKFFIRPLASGITKTYEVLTPYIADVRAESSSIMWDNYTWLYHEAEQVLKQEESKIQRRKQNAVAF